MAKGLWDNQRMLARAIMELLTGCRARQGGLEIASFRLLDSGASREKAIRRLPTFYCELFLQGLDGELQIGGKTDYRGAMKQKGMNLKQHP